MRTIRGKIALITGAASGIGRALALCLAREGADLFLVDIDGEKLDRVANEIAEWNVRVVTHVCDLANREQISGIATAVLKEFGAVDLLVNNAGVCYYGPTLRMTREQWDWLLGVNLEAPISLTLDLLPTLLSRPEAHVVNVASICGFVAGGRFAAYTVSKFGLVGFTEALRAEFGRQGLGVTCVCPGPVATNFFASAASGRENKPVPEPPKWACAKPELVAERTLAGIYRDRRLVLVTPMAHLVHYANRLAPWLFDLMNRWGRRRNLKRKASIADDDMRGEPARQAA